MPLNGPWQFALDPDARFERPADVKFDRVIEVPFSPETPASGIGDTSLFEACWYRREVDLPALPPTHRLLLHFGAVDYRATVWIDGQPAGYHEGGYTPFFVNVSQYAKGPAACEVVVRAADHPADLAKPRGKQDWLLESHSIWYPRTTGIWQTVWLEAMPYPGLASLRWTPNLERWELALDARIAGLRRREPGERDEGADLRLHVTLRVGDVLLAEDDYSVLGPEVSRRIALSDPGIDDYRNEFLWSPSTPTLIDAELELRRADGTVLDAVSSYTALRTVGIQGERVVLNGRPLYLRMVLDQGYWPETGLTAPDDVALRRDVELAKRMGFNGVRKHQKIEDPRYLYWADHLGLVVWEEMPSAYRFTRDSVERVTQQWMEAIHRDVSHPCIIAWVPFNESWGVPNLPDIPAERHFVEGLYHLTKTLDPTRPVVGNDGWESVATDIIGIHDYEDDAELLAKRYESEELLPNLFRRERPGGRLLTLEGHAHAGQPIMLTEFGGIALARDRESTWGYSRAASGRELGERYAKLAAAVRKIPLFAGFCYTQFTDTYQERNGLLYADRRPKFALSRMRTATRGPRKHRDVVIEREWRERVLRFQRDRRLAVELVDED
jgi:hypothetical protein